MNNSCWGWTSRGSCWTRRSGAATMGMKHTIVGFKYLRHMSPIWSLDIGVIRWLFRARQLQENLCYKVSWNFIEHMLAMSCGWRGDGIALALALIMWTMFGGKQCLKVRGKDSEFKATISVRDYCFLTSITLCYWFWCWCWCCHCGRCRYETGSATY